MEIFHIIAISMAICFLIAKEGENRKIGFGWSYFYSILLSPIIGVIITILSPKVYDNKNTSKLITIIGTTLFVFVMYIELSFISANYTEWIMQKKWVWIVLITILTIEIARRLLNKIPLLLGNLSGSTQTILSIVAVLDWVAKLSFFILNLKLTDFHDTSNIISHLFSFLLFFGLVNFLNYGIVFQCTKYEDREDIYYK
jgi:hypothetical protein